MMAIATAVDEAQRLGALRRYQVQDIGPEASFADLARLAAHVCGAPSGVICFVDEWYSLARGAESDRVSQIPREESVAGLVVALRESVVVPDTRNASPQVRALEAVARHGVRSFAAVPLLTADGYALGAIGACDQRPRAFGTPQLGALERLARQAMARLELRRQTQELVEAKTALEQEVAQRRAAEAALARGERRLRALVDNGSDIVTVVDADGTVTFASPSIERFLGYAPERVLGAKAFALVHPEDAGRVAAAFTERLAQPGIGQPTQFRFRASDGSWRCLEAVGTNAGPDSDVEGLVVVARDVTARVQAEETLRRREAILAAVSLFAEQLLRAASWRARLGEALKALGQSAGVTRVYVCERRRTNGGADTLVVEHEWVAEGHSPRGRAAMRQGVSLERVGLSRWAAALEAGEPIQGNAREFPKPERAVLRALAIRSMAAVPVRVGGEWWGFVGFGECRHEREWSAAEVDALRAVGNVLGAAVERQQMEEKLEATVQELAQSNAELEQFAYVASHDLQEPLRMVESYLGLVQRRYRGRVDASADEFVEHALDGAVRMRHLVRDLLAISRVGTRGREPRLTDVGETLGWALRDLGEAVRESGAVITRDELPTVMADETQLRQVLQNLLSNAIKFRGEGPCRIHVGATRGDGEWRIWVQDNGIGVPPQHAERIFAPFQRLHSRTEYPGTGIGLALCRKIVERHGGRIWVESVPGSGATFSFTIADRPAS